jgi:hypothetical protein
MSGSRSDWPGDFHPEFGLLCPSPRRRRGLRFALLSMVATMAVGATMGLAVAHWPDAEALASAGQPNDEQPLAAPIDASPVGHAQESCKAGATQDLVTFFFSSTCASSKPHARHHGARAGNRVATVILGRVDAAPSAPEPVAVAAIEPSQATAGVIATMTEKSTMMSPAPARPALPPKKSKAVSGAVPGAPIALNSPGRALSPQGHAINAAALSAYAATPRFGRDAFDSYDTSRVPFGRFR